MHSDILGVKPLTKHSTTLNQKMKIQTILADE